MDGFKNIEESVRDASGRICGYIRQTPIEESPYLGETGHSRVFFWYMRISYPPTIASIFLIPRNQSTSSGE